MLKKKLTQQIVPWIIKYKITNNLRQSWFVVPFKFICVVVCDS